MMPNYEERRAAVDRMAERIRTSTPGNVSHEQAREIAVRAAKIHERNKK